MAINAAEDVAHFVMDGDGNIVEWDSGAESIFGWSRDDVIGKRLSAVIIPERFRAVHEAGLERYKATGKGAFVGKTIEISTLHKKRPRTPGRDNHLDGEQRGRLSVPDRGPTHRRRQNEVKFGVA